MTVYIANRKTQSPPKYHTSPNCPMVKGYPNSYKAVPSRRRATPPASASAPAEAEPTTTNS